MRRREQSIWSSGILSMLAAVAAGIGCTLAAAALSTCLVFFVLKDMGLANALAGASLSAGSYVGAYIFGKHRRRRGMLGGVMCSTFMYIIIFAAGYMATGEITGIKKLLLLAVFGAAGGVAGVNSKRPAKLYQ